VDLNYNFRSVKGILDFVNKVFGRIMTREVAHIDYDEASMLHFRTFESEGGRRRRLSRSWNCTSLMRRVQPRHWRRKPEQRRWTEDRRWHVPRLAIQGLP
jgi:ATP-dependent exoDNAse (exonuclease V) beta subunit